MNINQLVFDLNRRAAEIRVLTGEILPVKAGNIAIEHFQDNFDREGFVDGGLKKWQDVERRNRDSEWYGFSPDTKDRFSPTRAADKILHDSSTLRGSITAETTVGGVVIGSKIEYAKVHNEGGTAKIFGKKEFQMPKRQFIGESRELHRKIQNLIDSELKKITKL